MVNANPLLKESRYDVASSWTFAIFASMVMVCGLVFMMYWSSRIPERKANAVPVDFIELTGGDENGSPDETLQLDTPEPERADASLAEVASEQTEMIQTLETVMELSESATQVVQQPVFESGGENAGPPGSSVGTGRRPLGKGPGNGGGYPREERWFIRFADRIPLDEYARQLEFFGIELGALLPGGRLGYLNKLSQPAPAIRYVNTGANEKRLFMSWQGGDRRLADTRLFSMAGVTVPADAPMFHFYPPDVENTLAGLEIAFKNRQPKQIRRTYFEIEKKNRTYKFVVVRQIPLQ